MAKQKMSGRMLDSIEPTILFRDVLSGHDLYAVLIALTNIENYVAGAMLQQGRIRRSDERLKRAGNRRAEGVF